MPYVDGFIVPVPKKSVQVYRRMAKKAGKIWREHGALEFCECVADDVKVGKLTSFPRSVKLKPSETVMFSWIVYRSRPIVTALRLKWGRLFRGVLFRTQEGTCHLRIACVGRYERAGNHQTSSIPHRATSSGK